MSAFRRVMTVAALMLSITGAFADCSGRNPIGYLCGIHGAEDIAAIPNSKWIVTSGLSQGDQPGGLSLIDRNRKTSTTLFPDSSIKFDYDSDTYPGCPGPVEISTFSAHGLNLRTGVKGALTLYVINHGSREAVEVFKLEAIRAIPVLSWIGCIVLPDDSMGNAVVPLPGRGIAVTLMTAPEYFSEPGGAMRQELWLEKLRAAKATGYAAQWSANEGWKRIPGTEASGPNGIEVSNDGRWLWVANWANREVVRILLQEDGSRSVLKLNFMPDNLRWGDDGGLWVTGAIGTPRGYFDCWAKPGCKNDFPIIRIDPNSLTLERIPHPNTLPEFGEATTALKVGREVWIAAYPSDRVGYLRLDNRTEGQ